METIDLKFLKQALYEMNIVIENTNLQLTKIEAKLEAYKRDKSMLETLVEKAEEELERKSIK